MPSWQESRISSTIPCPENLWPDIVIHAKDGKLKEEKAEK